MINVMLSGSFISQASEEKTQKNCIKIYKIVTPCSRNLESIMSNSINSNYKRWVTEKCKERLFKV